LKGASTVRRGVVGKVPMRQLASSLPYKTLQELKDYHEGKSVHDSGDDENPIPF
jgi:hypothetical protein